MIYLIVLGMTFAIFFPSLLILCLLLYAKRTFAFTKRSSDIGKGSGLIITNMKYV